MGLKKTGKRFAREEAKKLSQEKRQEFLDLFRQGKSIGKAGELCNISLDQACGIIFMNTKTIHYKTLNKISV